MWLRGSPNGFTIFQLFYLHKQLFCLFNFKVEREWRPRTNWEHALALDIRKDDVKISRQISFRSQDIGALIHCMIDIGS